MPLRESLRLHHIRQLLLVHAMYVQADVIKLTKHARGSMGSGSQVADSPNTLQHAQDTCLILCLAALHLPASHQEESLADIMSLN